MVFFYVARLRCKKIGIPGPDLILIAFLAINLATAPLSPTVWMDEVMFADPAINYRLTGNFNSTAWYAQTRQEFWSGNAPLHTMLLSQWLRLVPISPGGIRSINFIYMAAAALAFWQALRVISIVRAPFSRLLFVLLMLMGYGISFSYRSGRYDALGVLLVSLIALTIAKPLSASRQIALAALCAMLPWAGLQLIVLSFAVIAAHIGVYRSINKGHAIALCGVALGSLALLIFMAEIGTLSAFKQSVLSHTSAQASHAARAVATITHLPHLFRQDMSVVLLLPVLPIFLLFVKADRELKLFVAFISVAIVATAASLHLAGKFPIYYTWMIFIPLCAATALLVAQASGRIVILSIALCLSGLACIVGLPARLAVAVLDMEARNHERMSAYVSQRLKADDTAFVDFAAYYPSKLKAELVFLPPYLSIMSASDRAAITVAVLNGATPPAASTMFLTKEFGGVWTQAEPSYAPSRPGALSGLALASPYIIAIFRRTGP